MRFAKWVFLLAGIIGVGIVTPLYFLEERIGRDHPPPINHPEWYYGFVGVTLAWQLMYLVIGLNPIRHRPAMLPAIAAKGSFALTISILYALGRVTTSLLASSVLDATWLVLFIVAFLRTPKQCR